MPARLIPRIRLLTKLDSLAHDALIVVRGPAGSGKTVLLSTWLAERSETEAVLWISVDGIESVPELNRRIACELSEQYPAFSLHSKDKSTDTHVLIQRLRRLAQAEGRQLRIVLDGAEQLSDDACNALVMMASSTALVSYVVSTRVRRGFEDRLRNIELEIGTIAPKELHLTETEVRLELEAFGLDSSAYLEEVLDFSAGLASAVRTMNLALSEESGSLDRTNAYVIEALAQIEKAIHSDLGTDATNRLCQLAIAPIIDLDLAQAMGGEGGLGDLELAERRGWVEVEHGPRGPVYRFPEPYRRSLVNRCIRCFPDEKGRLGAAIARGQHQKGDYLIALEGALSIGELDLASSFLQDSWFHLISEGSDKLGSLLDALPTSKLHPHPWLIFFLGVCLLNRGVPQRFRARRTLTIAVESARRAAIRLEGAERAAVRALQSAAHRLLGEYTEAELSAGQALQGISPVTLHGAKGGPAVKDEAAESLIYEQAGMIRFVNGELETATNFFTAAAIGALAPAQRQLNFLNAALSSIKRGDVRRGREAYSKALEISLLDTNSLLGGVVEAYLHLESASIGDAEATLERIKGNLETSEYWFDYKAIETICALLQGTAGQVAGRFNHDILLRGNMLQGPRRESAKAMEALLWISTEKYDRARQALAETSRQSSLGIVAYLRLAMSIGDSRTIMRLVQTDISQFTPRTRVYMLLLRAVALHGQAPFEDNSLIVEDALHLMNSYGLALPALLMTQTEQATLHEIFAKSPNPALLTLPKMGLHAHLPFGQAAASLTTRETLVLQRLVVDGTAEDVAASLSVSRNTVKTQLRSVYRKLGVHSQSEAIKRAVALGLFDKQSPRI